MFKILYRIITDSLFEVGLLSREGFARELLSCDSLELFTSLLERIRLVDKVGQHGLASVLRHHRPMEEEVHQFVHNDLVCEDLGRFEEE